LRVIQRIEGGDKNFFGCSGGNKSEASSSIGLAVRWNWLPKLLSFQLLARLCTPGVSYDLTKADGSVLPLMLADKDITVRHQFS
jgi:hypothetical protein